MQAVQISPESNPGRDYLICETEGLKVGVFTVLGKDPHGRPKVGCPFSTADRLVTELEKQVDHIICETMRRLHPKRIHWLVLGWSRV